MPSSSYHPLVSIIINTHNGIEFLREAIDSAYAQTYSNTEILLYDNASTDDIAGVASEYDEKLRYTRSETFLTLGEARNEALKLAQGELIDFLDSDDIFLPHKLEKQVPLFENPEVGLAYSNTYHLLRKEGAGGWYDQLVNQKPLAEGKIFSNLLEHYCISFNTAIFRKSAIGEDPQGWFNTGFNMCTDYDLFLKISYHYQISYVDEALSKWRKHGENWSITRSYLLSTECFVMISRIQEYEPELFQKYPKQMRAYLASIYKQQSAYLGIAGTRFDAALCMWHALLLCFDIRTLVKAILLTVVSVEQYGVLRKKLRNITLFR